MQSIPDKNYSIVLENLATNVNDIPVEASDIAARVTIDGNSTGPAYSIRGKINSYLIVILTSYYII